MNWLISSDLYGVLDVTDLEPDDIEAVVRRAMKAFPNRKLYTVDEGVAEEVLALGNNCIGFKPAKHIGRLVNAA